MEERIVKVWNVKHVKETSVNALCSQGRPFHLW